MLSGPLSGRLEVLKVAWTGHGGGPQDETLNIPVPTCDPLLKNVTMPVGIVPAYCGDTVAVNVTNCMYVDGFTEEITVVVEVAGVTVTMPFM
jgi:hypothetical protein